MPPIASAVAIVAKDLPTTKAGPQHPPGFYGPDNQNRALNLAPSQPVFRALGIPARQLAADRRVLDASLKALPTKLRVLARTASYGSWFNFYTCGLSVELQLLGGQLRLQHQGVNVFLGRRAAKAVGTVAESLRG